MRFVLAWIATVTIVALGILVFSDGTAELVGFEAVLLGLVFLTLRSTSDARRSAVADFRYRRIHAEHLPPRLVEIERLSRFSQTSHVDFDRRLLPRLRVVTDGRLLSTHGFTLAESQGRAAEILGEPAWAILNPERELVSDVAVPGPSAATLESLIAAIESIEKPARPIQEGLHS